MFWQHYIESKKPIFLACISEYVYPVNLEYSKNNDVFSEPPNLQLPNPGNFHDMVCKKLQF